MKRDRDFAEVNFIKRRRRDGRDGERRQRSEVRSQRSEGRRQQAAAVGGALRFRLEAEGRRPLGTAGRRGDIVDFSSVKGEKR